MEVSKIKTSKLKFQKLVAKSVFLEQRLGTRLYFQPNLRLF